MELISSLVAGAALGVALAAADFAYEMLSVALRAVGAFVFWGTLICLFWGVATLCRVVVQWVKRYM